MNAYPTIVIQGHEMPVIKAVKKIVRDARGLVELAIIPCCPLCGERHIHGWGTGDRASHCKHISANYYLDCD